MVSPILNLLININAFLPVEYLIPVVIVFGIYGFIRMFAFPLLTRNPQEIILMLSPNKVKFYKITTRYLPMFTTKRGAYWFAEGKNLSKVEVERQIRQKQRQQQKFSFKRRPELEKLPPQTVKHAVNCAANNIHVYVDAINQPIYELDRIESKIMDLVIHRESMKQTKGHTVYIPPMTSAIFHRHWILRIKSDGQCELAATNKRQQYRIWPLKTLGVEMETVQVKGADSANASTILQTVTVQKVIQNIGGIEQNANFSAAFFFNIMKKIRQMEKGFIMNLLGMINPMILIVLIAMLGMIAAVFLLYKPPELPPPPPGLNL